MSGGSGTGLLVSSMVSYHVESPRLPHLLRHSLDLLRPYCWAALSNLEKDAQTFHNLLEDARNRCESDQARHSTNASLSRNLWKTDVFWNLISFPIRTCQHWQHRTLDFVAQQRCTGMAKARTKGGPSVAASWTRPLSAAAGPKQSATGLTKSGAKKCANKVTRSGIKFWIIDDHWWSFHDHWWWLISDNHRKWLHLRTMLPRAANGHDVTQVCMSAEKGSV